MSFRKGSLAKATSTTTGTGTLTLVNVAADLDSFLGAFGAGPRVVKYIIRGSGGYREIGVGVWDSAGPNTLTRVSVIRSSAGGSLVSLPAGTHDVYAWDMASWEMDVLTGSPSLTIADLFSGQLYTGTGGTLSLPALAGLPPGIAFPVFHLGTGTLTIDPNASEQINGATTLALSPGSCAWIFNRDTATAQWIALVGLSSVPASLGAAQTFTAAQIIRAAATALLNLESTDAGAGEGPILDLHRDSASPAASDLIGSLTLSMESSTSVKRTAAKILASILDATNASEDADLRFQTIVAGTLATRMIVGQGVVLGAAAGGDPGAGIINATDYEVNGVSILGAQIKTEANWDQSGTPTARRSTNLSTIGDNGVGDATLNRTNSLASADPSFGTCANQISSGTHSATGPNLRGTGTTDMTTASIRVQIGNAATGALADRTVATYLEVGA